MLSTSSSDLACPSLRASRGLLFSLVALWLAGFPSDLMGAEPSTGTSRWAARRGRLVVWVAEPNHEPVEGAVVTVEQIGHEFLFGTRIEPDLLTDTAGTRGEKYRDILLSHFNAVSTGDLLSWRVVQPSSTSYVWRMADRVAAWCRIRGLPLLAERIVSAHEMPSWALQMESEPLQNALAGFAEALGANFRTQIAAYEILRDPPQGPQPRSETTPRARTAASGLLAADPSAMLYIGESAILHDPDRCAQLVEFVREWTSNDTPLAGLCAGAGELTEPNVVRMTACLNILAQCSLPLLITDLSLSGGSLSENASHLTTLLTTLFEHPAVAGLFLAGFRQPDVPGRSSVPLYTAALSPTPCAEAYDRLIRHTWHTKAEGRTDRVGRFECEGFWGTYRITAIASDGRRSETVCTLSRRIGKEFVVVHLLPPEHVGPAAGEPAARDKLHLSVPTAEDGIPLF